ncbi:MAG: hypothetical protein JJ850_07960 [Kordiimonadaceae bacterium]|nr:hypothetical protein [Kordiimonadaceae bacterium]MBO6569062.1 hypothetical protein [Kordiimonadaceae bacterium]MBO6964537.1 hypothetical protein [Kordiimonadaceae bacterium]
MKSIFASLLLMVLSLQAAADHHEAQEHSSPAISYIGFNKLKADHKAHRIAAFKDYIKTIKPIMERYGHTLEVYKVDHANIPEHAADFVTFGTAPSQEAFQSFFADTEFQRAFPTLVENIDQHFVTFLDVPIVPEKRDHGHYQLTMDWLKPMDDGMTAAYAEKKHQLMGLAAHAGAQQTHHAKGTMASVGLTDDLSPEEPPTLVTLWHMTDPHGFLDQDKVRDLNTSLAEFSNQQMVFWISPARIGH